MTSSTTLRGGGLRGAIAAEWTKMWTVRSTRWLFWGSLLLTAASTAVLASTLANNNRTDGVDRTWRIGDLAGDTTFYVVQLMVGALAMLIMTSEYTTRSISSTLQWVPNRGRLLLAKCVVIAGVNLVLGFMIGVVGVVTTALTISGYGEAPPGRTVYQTFAIAVFLSLAGVMTVYVAALVRSAPASLTALVLVNMAVPALMQGSGIIPLMELSQYTAAIGGRNLIMIDTGPYPAGVGLLVLVAWVVGGFFVTRHFLIKRDA